MTPKDKLLTELKEHQGQSDNKARAYVVASLVSIVVLGVIVLSVMLRM